MYLWQKNPYNVRFTILGFKYTISGIIYTDAARRVISETRARSLWKRDRHAARVGLGFAAELPLGPRNSSVAPAGGRALPACWAPRASTRPH